jgi:hypothetical protein
MGCKYKAVLVNILKWYMEIEGFVCIFPYRCIWSHNTQTHIP